MFLREKNKFTGYNLNNEVKSYNVLYKGQKQIKRNLEKIISLHPVVIHNFLHK